MVTGGKFGDLNGAMSCIRLLAMFKCILADNVTRLRVAHRDDMFLNVVKYEKEKV